MKLIYRGIQYTTEARNIEMKETEISMKFRGASYKLYRPLCNAARPVEKLTYRGTPYSIECQVCVLAEPSIDRVPAFG
ncbi:MAG: DUF4278 domain-containing protein [Cyanobacteria bacterium SID2]|nr:DUF4278 domain-containing protein [Cyanobacteria bacterium SID2]MBP0002797.1 DUF4278 domain-containing protein [Cyanobacteria bacterium SBC]